MKASSRRIAFFVAYVTIAGSLWTGSEWWEKSLATPLGKPSISPNSCYRVETFKPFWILPDTFHRRSHPDEDRPPQWLPWWGYPGFYRLYDHRSGEQIGESKIYDLQSTGGRLSWGDRTNPQISAGYISIGPGLPDCIGDRPDNMKPGTEPPKMAPPHGEFLFRSAGAQ